MALPTEDMFDALDRVEWQVYWLFIYAKGSNSVLVTPPLSKQEIAERLDMSRATLDKAIKRLVELEYIAVIPHPQRKLVVEFPNPYAERLTLWDEQVANTF